MNISDIQLLFEYNYWANQKILSKAAELTPEEFTQSTSFSWGSVRGTLIHILDAEHVWRYIFQHHSLPDNRIPQTEPFPTLDSILTFWNNEETQMRAYLDSLQDSDMEKIVQYKVREGSQSRVVWHGLVHVVNHGTQHRSEVAAMLTDFGHSPGEIDLLHFPNVLSPLG